MRLTITMAKGFRCKIGFDAAIAFVTKRMNDGDYETSVAVERSISDDITDEQGRKIGRYTFNPGTIER